MIADKTYQHPSDYSGSAYKLDNHTSLHYYFWTIKLSYSKNGYRFLIYSSKATHFLVGY
jgi:hypothetical protein